MLASFSEWKLVRQRDILIFRLFFKEIQKKLWLNQKIQFFFQNSNSARIHTGSRGTEQNFYKLKVEAGVDSSTIRKGMFYGVSWGLSFIPSRRRPAIEDTNWAVWAGQSTHHHHVELRRPVDSKCARVSLCKKRLFLQVHNQSPKCKKRPYICLALHIFFCFKDAQLHICMYLQLKLCKISISICS